MTGPDAPHPGLLANLTRRPTCTAPVQIDVNIHTIVELAVTTWAVTDGTHTHTGHHHDPNPNIPYYAGFTGTTNPGWVDRKTMLHEHAYHQITSWVHARHPHQALLLHGTDGHATMISNQLTELNPDRTVGTVHHSGASSRPGPLKDTLQKLDREVVAKLPVLTVATDGSASRSAHGYGWVTTQGAFNAGGGLDRKWHGYNVTLAELQAIRDLLTRVDPRQRLRVLCDSTHVVRELTRLVTTQQVPHWANHLGQGRLDRLTNPRFGSVTFEWVRGHAGHRWNTVADRLAVQGRRTVEAGVGPNLDLWGQIVQDATQAAPVVA